MASAGEDGAPPPAAEAVALLVEPEPVLPATPRASPTSIPDSSFFPFSDASPSVTITVAPQPVAEALELEIKAKSAEPSRSESLHKQASKEERKSTAEAAADAAHRDQQERNAKAKEIRKPRYQSVFSSSLSMTPTTTMLAFDIETYGPEWTAAERKSFALCALLHLIWLLAMLTRVWWWDGAVHIPGWYFWMRQAVMVGGLSLVFAASGLLAVVSSLNISYCRKICHLALFASSPLFMFLWPYKAESSNEASWAALWTVWSSFLPYYLFIKPVRRRSTFALLCFRALDREEDRPHTLEWLVTQAVAGLATVIAIMLYLESTAPPGRPGRVSLVMIPILVNGLGDGLAEPVGVRWGRHKYTTRALWYQGRCCAGAFTRSLEGSAVVFFTGVLVVGLFRTFFSAAQFAVLLSLIPPVLTAAEAFSPHTWDTPFIIGTGGLILCLTLQYVPGCGDACIDKLSFFGAR